jgi:hypothetical protein
MKMLSWLSGGTFVLIMLFCTTTPMTSCVKETIRDTITIRDTVTLPCECENEEDLKRGLIAYYNFNNGTLNDSSGKGNHIIFNNATPTTDRLGRPNNAYLFDGASNYMKIMNSPSLSPASEITLAAIVKPTGWYSGKCYGNQILGKVDNTDYQNGVYWLRFSHESLDCSDASDIESQLFYGVYGDNSYNSAAGVKASEHRITKGEWYKVVYTQKEGKSSLYVNGTLVGESDKASPFTPNNSDLFIGKSNSSEYPYWFKGVIDEVRIYEKALCAEEVEALNKLTK